MWNPPALTAVKEEQDGDSGDRSHVANRVGVNFMFSSFQSLDFAGVSRNERMDLNRSTGSDTDANLIDLRTLKSDFNLDFRPPPGYPINALSRLPMGSSGTSSASSSSSFVDNFGATGNKTNDGDFLSLGIPISAMPSSSRLNPNLPIPRANPQYSLSRMYDKIPRRGYVTQSRVMPQQQRQYYRRTIEPSRTHIFGRSTVAMPQQQQLNASFEPSRAHIFGRRSSVNSSLETSTSHSFGESTVTHAQLGRLIPITEARRAQSNAAGVRFPVSAQHMDTCESATSPGCPISRVEFSKFPKRLGIQANEEEPTVPTIGGHGSSAVTRPRMKRPTTANSSTAHSSRRRNMAPKPVTRNSPSGQSPISSPSPNPQPSQIPPARPHHIKWQGFDEARKPSGYKCLLCKRDLSFTPEGQVYQPSIPPAVAVLPCGHTFHDDCLQIVTSKDCAKEPPCIPCALGQK